jgi:hypothetical protein
MAYTDGFFARKFMVCGGWIIDKVVVPKGVVFFKNHEIKLIEFMCLIKRIFAFSYPLDDRLSSFITRVTLRNSAG